MTNLFLDRILEFYDVPQILVAKDSFGTQYLCLLFDDGAGCRYTGIKISSSRLDDYLGGRIDLRTLYLNPENDNEYFNVSYNDNHYELQSFVIISKKTPIYQPYNPLFDLFCLYLRVINS